MPSTAFLRCQIHRIRVVPQIYPRQRSRGIFPMTSTADPIDMHPEGPCSDHVPDSYLVCSIYAVHKKATCWVQAR